MTDRVYAFTVILEKETRDDDVRAITDAIHMIRGVSKVTPLVADPALYFAVESARRDLGEKLWRVLYPSSK